jgi:hypothetical protein
MSGTLRGAEVDYRSEALRDFGVAREVADRMADGPPFFWRKVEDIIRLLGGGIGNLAVKLATVSEFSGTMAQLGGRRAANPVSYPVSARDITGDVLQAMHIVAGYTDMPVTAELPDIELRVEPGTELQDAILRYTQTSQDDISLPVSRPWRD